MSDNFFTYDRQDTSYDLSPSHYKNVLADKTSPLKCLLDKIEPNSSVLDIGCGNGIFASLVRQCKEPSLLVGIEPSPYACDIANGQFDMLYNGFFHEHIDDLRKYNFDYIILADVLEHVSDPYMLLSEIVTLLSPRSSLLLSVPNIAFGACTLSLMNGNFEYSDSGILEKTHLRFFTLKAVTTLLRDLSLDIHTTTALNKSWYKAEFKRNQLGSVFSYLYLLLSCPKESLAYQYVISCGQSFPPKQLLKSKLEHITIGPKKINLLVDFFFANLPYRVMSFVKARIHGC